MSLHQGQAPSHLPHSLFLSSVTYCFPQRYETVLKYPVASASYFYLPTL